jgi:hypothetical protein
LVATRGGTSSAQGNLSDCRGIPDNRSNLSVASRSKNLLCGFAACFPQFLNVVPVITMPPLVTVLSVNTLLIGTVFFGVAGGALFGVPLGTRFFIWGRSTSSGDHRNRRHRC